MISDIEFQYLKLVNEILSKGIVKKPSKGVTFGISGASLTIKPDEVPLLNGRKIHYKGLIGELQAFIANENTVEGFSKRGCNFWGAWGDSSGKLDIDYAKLLHDFNGVNQLDRLVNNLRVKPDSRKHIISLWNPASKSKQVPCVLSYQWVVDENELVMIWTQRSADVMLGLASDIFSAWLFNQVLANEVGLKPGKVIINIGDAHIYKKHLRQVYAYKKSVLENNATPAKFKFAGSLHDFTINIFDYRPAAHINFELFV